MQLPTRAPRSSPLQGLTLALASLASLALAPTAARAAELTLEIDPVTATTGTVQIAIYNSETNFRKEAVRSVKVTPVAGTLKVVIDQLPAGDYAVMLFHDVNGNDKLDSNLMGIPKEPWGGSVGNKAMFGPPGWNDARFMLPEAGVTVRIKLSD